MEKFVPYEKLSKRRKKEVDKKRRIDWGQINPVTRTVKNGKAYDRKKFRRTSLNSEWDGISSLCIS